MKILKYFIIIIPFLIVSCGQIAIYSFFDVDSIFDEACLECDSKESSINIIRKIAEIYGDCTEAILPNHQEHFVCHTQNSGRTNRFGFYMPNEETVRFYISSTYGLVIPFYMPDVEGGSFVTLHHKKLESLFLEQLAAYGIAYGTRSYGGTGKSHIFYE